MTAPLDDRTVKEQAIKARAANSGSSGLRLADVLASFDELLLLPDHSAVNVSLATVVANYSPDDALWTLLVGPSGGGKTEIVNAITKAPDVWPLSSVTPQTFLSGFEKTRDGKPASLLLRIGAFGVLAFKDLTSVLTLPRDARSQILGQLREIADGKTHKPFGNGLQLYWEGKIGLLAGVTPYIDELHSVTSVMGERFVLYRLPKINRKAVTRRALERRGHEKELRERIRNTAGDFLAGFQGCSNLELPESFEQPLIDLADVVTRARSGVARDGYTRDMLYQPEPEAPTRLAKHLMSLGAALLAIGVDPTETWRIVRKAGWDSVPSVRTALLDILDEYEEPVTHATISERAGLPTTTVERTVGDLVALGLLRRHKSTSNVWMVEQHEDQRAYRRSSIAPLSSGGSPETREGEHALPVMVPIPIVPEAEAEKSEATVAEREPVMAAAVEPEHEEKAEPVQQDAVAALEPPAREQLTIGDTGYISFLKRAFDNKHITKPEALQRRELHKQIEAARIFAELIAAPENASTGPPV